MPNHDPQPLANTIKLHKHWSEVRCYVADAQQSLLNGEIDDLPLQITSLVWHLNEIHKIITSQTIPCSE